MRVAVVFFAGAKRNKVRDLAQGVADSLERQGHAVTLIDGDQSRNTKLTVYDYLVLGTSVTSPFRGRIDSRIGEFLSQAGNLLGKKSFAFVVNAPFGAQRGLSRLMDFMEREGLFLRFSEILRSREEADQVVRRLKIDR
ncbi:hypothetical protein SAMN05920897_102111 [Alkalispirochaeta americana]|uniref:Flavodoxin domain-containing protein n=1 Tax=Alkalispirochaeta americana TaxID=159291 RepID=A0A1N6P3S5_9SPIO|nr:hypothetical protein [Alkalispirochaeta americana]SIP98927.1 hypothetical protein SAMN05920897_102111 [Alkalispirochaeta americana]